MRKLKQLSALLLAAVLVFTTIDTQGMRVNASERIEVSSEITSEQEAVTEEISTEECIQKFMLFSNDSMTEARFGLTVTQTSGEKGFTMGSKAYDGYVYISKPGSYTITGTINAEDVEYFTKDWVSRNAYSTRGLIEIDNNIQGTVDLTLDNVDVTTNYWQTPPLVISKSVGAASVNSSTDVNITLKGDNKLTTTSGGTAAIVKQGGSGTLTFSGSGSLTATGVSVAIGSPALCYASDNIITPNCNNIIFKHSGTITAINSSGADAVVGTSGNSDATQRTRYASNIQLQSGTLILQSNNTTQTSKKSFLGGGRLSEASNIVISGGTLKIPGSSAGSEWIAVGSGGNRYNSEFENSSVSVTGGTIISEYKVLKPKNDKGTRVYKTVVDCGTANANKAVESLAITVDGESYPYGTANMTTDENGKLYLYLPYTGSASVTVFDKLYYGKVSDPNENILGEYHSADDITAAVPSTMNANTKITLHTSGVSPETATANTITWKVTNAGETGATIKNNVLTAPFAGTIELTATVYDGTAIGTNLTKIYTITVSHKAITDINPGFQTEVSLNQTVDLTKSTVEPSDASYKAITWELVSDGGTGATLNNNKLTPTASGEIKVKATVANGLSKGVPYTREFTITTSFVAVTDVLANFPTTFLTNTSIDLSRHSVMPDNVSFKTVAWDVKEKGTTGLTITDNTMKATSAGTATITATIPNGTAIGTDYTKEIVLTIVAPSTENLDISKGDIVITKVDENQNKITSNSINNDAHSMTQSNNLPVTITGTATDKTVTVDGTEAILILNGITVTAADADMNDRAPIEIINGADVTMLLQGTNTVTTKDMYISAIHVPENNRLTINGMDSGSSSAVLKTVSTNSQAQAAAIGGKNGENSGTITLNGSNVTVKQAYTTDINNLYAAAIGGGANGGSGTVVIRGGTVTTDGIIGGGFGGTKGGTGTVTIYDGEVNARRIGGGNSKTVGGDAEVTIYGGTVTATQGINSGRSYDSTTAVAGKATIKIHGGTVTATVPAGIWSAAIGSGDSKGTVSEGTILSDITIDGGIVKATANASSNYTGAAIGGGEGNDGGTITISGGEVTAISSGDRSFSAAIGGGNEKDGGTITISGGQVTANASWQAAAIGGGNSGGGGNITITGGVVNANSVYGSAIGPGANGADGNVTISGGTIVANTENIWSACIKGTIQVTGGSIRASKDFNATNASATPVYKTTVDLTAATGNGNPAVADSLTFDGTAYSYGFHDVQTDADGKVYLYLPVSKEANASFAGKEYTGELTANHTNTLSMVAALSLGEPKNQTGAGVELDVTADADGTVYAVLSPKGGTVYTTLAELKAVANKQTLPVTADTAKALSLTAQEGEYVLYAVMEGTGTVSKVTSKAITIEGIAPAADDVIIDFAGEKLKAKSGLSYTLAVSNSVNSGDWTELSEAGIDAAPYMGSTVIVKKKYTASTFGEKVLSVAIPARPSAPAQAAFDKTLNSIKAKSTAANAVYSIDSWATSNTTGEFTGLTVGTGYVVRSRFPATADDFASEERETDVMTTFVVEAPTKDGAGGSADGNTVSADKTTGELGDVVVYTIKSTADYMPLLYMNGNTTPVLLEKSADSWTYSYTITPAYGTIQAKVTFNEKAVESIAHANSVTLFADDTANQAEAGLKSYLDSKVKVTAAYDNGTTDSITAAYTLKTGTWSATGGSYTYTAKAGEKECDVAVNVKAVNGTVAAIADRNKVKNVTDGYASYDAIGLPNKLTVTYTGDGYTTKTSDLDITWTTAVPTDFGKTVTAEPQVFNGTVALPAWATGSNAVSAKVNITDRLPIDSELTVSIDGWTYGDTAKQPKAGKKSGSSISIDGTKFTFRYNGTANDGTIVTDSDTAPTKAGTYTVTAKYMDDTQIGSVVSKAFVVARKEITPALSATGVTKAYDGDTQVKGTVQPVLAFTGTINSENPVVTATYCYDTKDAGTDKTIHATAITLTTDVVNANYTLTKATASAVGAVITKTTPVVTVPANLHAITNTQKTLADVIFTQPTDGVWTWNAPKTALTASDDNKTQTFKATFTPADSKNYDAVEKDITIGVSGIVAEFDTLDIKTITAEGGTAEIAATITIIGEPLKAEGNVTLDKVVTWDNSCPAIVSVTSNNSGASYKATVKGLKKGISMVGIAVNKQPVSSILVKYAPPGGGESNNAAEEINQVVNTIATIVSDPDHMSETEKAVVNAAATEIISLPQEAKKGLSPKTLEFLDSLYQKSIGITATNDVITDGVRNPISIGDVAVKGMALASGATSTADVKVEIRQQTPTQTVSGKKSELEFIMNFTVDGAEQQLQAPLLITIPLPSGVDTDGLIIKHTKSDSSSEDITCADTLSSGHYILSGRNVTMWVNSFSTFTFMTTVTDAGDNNNGNNSGENNEGNNNGNNSGNQSGNQSGVSPVPNNDGNVGTGDLSYADVSTGKTDSLTGENTEVAPSEDTTEMTLDASDTMTPSENELEQDELPETEQENEAKGINLTFVFLGIALLLAAGVFAFVKKNGKKEK